MKIKTGETFHDIELSKDNTITVGRPIVVVGTAEDAWKKQLACSVGNFVADGSTYTEEHLWPCEIDIRKPLTFDIKPLCWAKTEDIEAAKKGVADGVIKACRADIEEAQGIVDRRKATLEAMLNFTNPPK